MKSLKEWMSKIVLCQSTMVIDIANTQFPGQKKNKSKWQNKRQMVSWGNKKPHREEFGVFHLGTPKTVFLLRNLPLDPLNLDNFPTNKVSPFNCQKRAEKTSPFSLVVCICWRIFRFLCLVPKNAPEVSRIYVSYFGWRVKYSESTKTDFVNELIEVWRTLNTYIWLSCSKYLSHIYENFQTFFQMFHDLHLRVYIFCKNEKCSLRQQQLHNLKWCNTDLIIPASHLLTYMAHVA